MPTAIYKIVDSFMLPTIDPVIGTPTYKTIGEVNLKLNLKPAYVQSNLGCGTLGLLQLTVSAAVYATLSATAFIVTVNPGSETVITDASTGPQTAELRYAHDVATILFNEYDRTKKSLHQILLSTVDDMFIRYLRHKYVVYITTSTPSILDYLYATYFNISSSDLQDNEKLLRAPYDDNQPIKSLFDQV